MKFDKRFFKNQLVTNHEESVRSDSSMHVGSLEIDSSGKHRRRELVAQQLFEHWLSLQDPIDDGRINEIHSRSNETNCEFRDHFHMNRIHRQDVHRFDTMISLQLRQDKVKLK